MYLTILKKINRYLPEDFRLFLLPWYRKFFPSLNNIMFIPSLKCNYSCAYCIFNRFTPFGLKNACHTYTEWIQAFQEFPPSAVIITGGEPFLYKDIVPLIEDFPSKHLLSCLVTNLSVNIDKLASLKKKEFRIMASFHPSMVSREDFAKNLRQLKSAGFNNITVNFVAYPAYLKDITYFKKTFEESKGILFRVDTFKDPQVSYTPEELKLIREFKKEKIIAADRTEGYDFGDYSKKTCKGGSKFFLIISNGNVYSCVEGYYYTECLPYKDKYNKADKFYLGNVFDNTFRISKTDKICHSPCAEICDRELAGVKKAK